MGKTVSGFTSSFLLSWKSDIVLGVLNKRRDPILHDTHSKSIIEWLIVFTFLPLSLPSSSCDKDAKVKTFWNDFFEIRGSLSNRAQSASILSLFHAGAENQPLHNEAEKWEKRNKSFSAGSSEYKPNASFVSFVSLLLGRVLANRQIF